MLKGLWKLTWIEIKVFLREPMGAFGAIAVPVITFLVISRLMGGRDNPSRGTVEFLTTGLPVFAAVLITLASVLSLITIISIYREGGILKRLRATPLTPLTILTTHVIVKLILTLVTLLALVAAGKTWGAVEPEVNLLSFAIALLLATASIMSLGFVIASIVPTARFAQPLASVLLYPMIALSGLFFPVEKLPGIWQAISRALPLTYAVGLLKGIWNGGGWIEQWPNLLALSVFFVVCTAISSRVFRWE
jgi:ABC-2 type transport system permease protein